ncbi:MAG: hypothetical protein ACI3ZT_08070 [Candidatus Cryptobacteroides sp.]
MSTNRRWSVGQLRNSGSSTKTGISVDKMTSSAGSSTRTGLSVDKKSFFS